MNPFKLLLTIACLCASTAFARQSAETPKQPNILFIAIDDLRPELGAYGADYVHSPNLDRLAAQSSLFKNHFVTVPTCGASRYNLLVGKLPKSTVEIGNMAAVQMISQKEKAERPETFLEKLRGSGYYTVGIGKISHHPDGYVYDYLEPKSDQIELPDSWDEMLFDAGKWGTAHHAFFGYADGSNRNTLKGQVKPYEAADVGDEGYADGLTANLAVEKLKELKGKNQPFFLGLGFFKPHLPFTAPKKYWDLYEEEAIPLAPFSEIPENSSKASLLASGEFNQYALGEEKASLDAAMSEEYSRKIRHAYLAAVSYVDAQVGKVLDELERQGLAENTIVIVWGDHGWHLGDQLVWGKHTLFDRALQSVLMVRRPGKPGNQIEQVVSTTDIFPTLLELAGMPRDLALDGESMLVLMDSPDSATWRDYAYSYYNRGISVRTSRYRLTEYFRKEGKVMELYDFEVDPFQTKNIAAENPEKVEELLKLLEKGDTGLYQKPPADN
ncbi:sulfatase [Algoriphagus sp. H41]|uniref:Sulfatase n=1 Tax=Algoriphagus oliviformis TaxID=2811231 RepID=A0ABS3C447_9BACT|nr:sulfatase [Algoriphagus oliviformis]MBN7811650.1 sulfatase [Algoriphagus oliviformis]